MRTVSSDAPYSGWWPRARSMIESLRCPRTMPGAVCTPLSSGPRCATHASIGSTAAGSSGRVLSSAAYPAIPHIVSARLWRRAPEAAPAVAVVMLDGHVRQADSLEPAGELVTAQVERDGCDE